MTIVNDFSPFLFEFELFGREFGLRYYSLAYIIGFVMAYLVLNHAAKSGRIKNLTEENAPNLVFAGVIGVIVGGRMGFVLQNLDQWQQDALFPLKVYEGGMAFFGGLIGVILAFAWFCKKNQVQFWDVADWIAIPAAVALGLGRIANFINGELWGRPTNAEWGVIYPHVDTQLRHPSELYESASHFALALVLFALWKLLPKSDPKKTGYVGASFIIGYGVFRFITEFFREEPQAISTLTKGHMASLVAIAIGISLLLAIRAGRKPQPS